jgi:hypothetical protein
LRIIAHRRNTINELIATQKNYGIEVDVRSNLGQLIIQHDPFLMGEDFESWIKNYNHKTLILNVKEEGLEERLIDLMLKYSIKDYFFLDQSFPFLIKWSKLGISRSAVRVSEFESIQTAINLKGLVDWVWVDFFNKFPLSQADVTKLKASNFKICIVSPELQGKEAESEIPKLFTLLNHMGVLPDAVCTKRPELWESSLARLTN